MATINIGELATVALRNRSKSLADNISTHNLLLKKLSEKGNIRTADGGRDIVEELMYAENGTADWYDGYDTLDTTPQDVLDASTWDWKQLAGTVSLSGREEMQNSGKERIFNWLKARMDVLEITLKNKLAIALFSDGTAAKQVGGLRLIVADDPTAAATVGGIAQATYSFWRNKKTGSIAATASTLLGNMNTHWIKQVRGNDKPDLVIYDSAYYAAYEGALQPNQRFMDPRTADAGFDHILYKQTPVIYDANCPSGHGYFLNTNYIFLRPHSQRQFVPLDRRESFNQDASVLPVVWMGNLTCSNRSLQGVITTAA